MWTRLHTGGDSPGTTRPSPITWSTEPKPPAAGKTSVKSGAEAESTAPKASSDTRSAAATPRRAQRLAMRSAPLQSHSEGGPPHGVHPRRATAVAATVASSPRPQSHGRYGISAVPTKRCAAAGLRFAAAAAVCVVLLHCARAVGWPALRRRRLRRGAQHVCVCASAQRIRGSVVRGVSHASGAPAGGHSVCRKRQLRRRAAAAGRCASLRRCAACLHV